MKELPVHCACFVSVSDLFDSLGLRGKALCVAHENITDGPAAFGHGAVKVCLVDQEYLATICDISPRKIRNRVPTGHYIDLCS